MCGRGNYGDFTQTHAMSKERKRNHSFFTVQIISDLKAHHSIISQWKKEPFAEISLKIILLQSHQLILAT